MTNPYRDYAFTEIAARKSSEDNLGVSFIFVLNAREILALRNATSETTPSFRCVAATLADRNRCNLFEVSSTPVKADGTSSREATVGVAHVVAYDQTIPRNLPAIFATTGYLCTEHQRSALIETQPLGLKREGLPLQQINPIEFFHTSQNLLTEATRFYATMLLATGKRAGLTDMRGKNLETDVRFRIHLVAPFPKAVTFH